MTLAAGKPSGLVENLPFKVTTQQGAAPRHVPRWILVEANFDLSSLRNVDISYIDGLRRMPEDGVPIVPAESGIPAPRLVGREQGVLRTMSLYLREASDYEPQRKVIEGALSRSYELLCSTDS